MIRGWLAILVAVVVGVAGFWAGYQFGMSRHPLASIGRIVLDADGSVATKPDPMQGVQGQPVHWDVDNTKGPENPREVELGSWRPWNPLQDPVRGSVPAAASRRLSGRVDPNALRGGGPRWFYYTISVDGQDRDPEIYIK